MTKHLNQDKLDWLPLRTWPPHSYNSWWSKFIKTNWNNWHEILLNNWKWEHYFNIILKDPNCDLCIKSFFRTGVKVLTESGEKYVWYDLLIQSCLDLKCKINREKIETLDPCCSSLDFKWWQMPPVTSQLTQVTILKILNIQTDTFYVWLWLGDNCLACTFCLIAILRCMQCP